MPRLDSIMRDTDTDYGGLQLIMEVKFDLCIVEANNWEAIKDHIGNYMFIS